MTKHRDGFEVYQGGCSTNKDWYWRLCRRGRIVADGSEGYTRKADAFRAVRHVRRWLRGVVTVPVTVVERDKKR